MLDVAKPDAARPAAPFDTGRLDRLLEDAGIDVLLATSKHNVQYLLGGHRSIFFDYMDATGITRYLPVFIYPKGAPDKAAYIGHRLESHQKEVAPFWTAEASTSTSGSTDATEKAIAYLRKAGLKAKRIGVEMPFLPADAAETLRAGLPDSELGDADELALLRQASELVIDSMLAVISRHPPGTSKHELFEALRREEVNRGMTFEYCLLTAGTSLNRAPSDQRWEMGDIISLDSGGNYHGYIGDLCRMAIQGEPDAELEDLLGEIETIQRSAMAPIKAGAMGSVIYGAATPLVRQSKNHNHLHFLAHGMGLVSHEAPRLAPRGSMAYDPYDADYPLETGMVISVETTLHHPRRGFIKLEDTVAVTDTGFEIYGEGARGWNRGGTAVSA
jgi:Xaa-Pro aminopeptidase